MNTKIARSFPPIDLKYLTSQQQNISHMIRSGDWEPAFCSALLLLVWAQNLPPALRRALGFSGNPEVYLKQKIEMLEKLLDELYDDYVIDLNLEKEASDAD